MTCKAIFFYTTTGNTKSLIDECDTTGYEIYSLIDMEPKEVNFNNFDTILIGTPTLGDGVPPDYFKSISRKLSKLKDKKIGLFGSGNTHYQYYCGALDLLEDFLKPRNNIIFKFKFESYPTDLVKSEFQVLLDKILKGENLNETN